MTLTDDLVVRLKGKADRIDRSADGRLVVADYKTGGARPYDGLGPDDPVMHGHRLQLPVYALAARDRFGAPETPVRAEYWFATRKGGFTAIGYDVDDAVLAELRAALTVIVGGIRSGLFPPRPKADSGAYHCVYCDADGLGDQPTTRAWERVRTAPELTSYVALIHGDSHG